MELKKSWIKKIEVLIFITYVYRDILYIIISVFWIYLGEHTKFAFPRIENSEVSKFYLSILAAEYTNIYNNTYLWTSK